MEARHCAPASPPLRSPEQKTNRERRFHRPLGFGRLAEFELFGDNPVARNAECPELSSEVRNEPELAAHHYCIAFHGLVHHARVDGAHHQIEDIAPTRNNYFEAVEIAWPNVLFIIRGKISPVLMRIGQFASRLFGHCGYVSRCPDRDDRVRPGYSTAASGFGFRRTGRVAG
jgi:hypothetical protein